MKKFGLVLTIFLFMSTCGTTSELPCFFAQSRQYQLAKEENTINQIKKVHVEEKTKSVEQIQSSHLETPLEKNIMMAWLIARTALMIGMMYLYAKLVYDWSKSFYSMRIGIA